MTWDGVTPVSEVVNDLTPVVHNRCSCGSELILVDANEHPPMTPEEIDLQFHCLMSRAGDWFFCMSQAATWTRVAKR